MPSPPGLYSTYTATDHEVTVHARFAAFDEHTDPIKAYVFNARTYTVEGVEVTPIKEQHDDTDEYNYVAEYIGPTTTPEINKTGVVFYHFDEFNGLCMQERITQGEYETAVTDGELPVLPSFIRYYVLSELHELCHWALNSEEQPTGDNHSPVWNAVLTGVIDHATKINTTDPDFDYTFATPENTPVTVPDLTMDSEDSHAVLEQRQLSTMNSQHEDL